MKEESTDELSEVDDFRKMKEESIDELSEVDDFRKMNESLSRRVLGKLQERDVKSKREKYKFINRKFYSFKLYSILFTLREDELKHLQTLDDLTKQYGNKIIDITNSVYLNVDLDEVKDIIYTTNPIHLNVDLSEVKDIIDIILCVIQSKGEDVINYLKDFWNDTDVQLYRSLYIFLDWLGADEILISDLFTKVNLTEMMFLTPYKGIKNIEEHYKHFYNRILIADQNLDELVKINLSNNKSENDILIQIYEIFRLILSLLEIQHRTTRVEFYGLEYYLDYINDLLNNLDFNTNPEKFLLNTIRWMLEDLHYEEISELIPLELRKKILTFKPIESQEEQYSEEKSQEDDAEELFTFVIGHLYNNVDYVRRDGNDTLSIVHNQLKHKLFIDRKTGILTLDNVELSLRSSLRSLTIFDDFNEIVNEIVLKLNKDI